LRFTITNNAAFTLTGLAFNHTLPGGLTIPIPPALPPAATPECGAAAALAAPQGGNTIAFGGGTVAPGQTCIVTIPVETAFTFPNPGDAITYVSNPVVLSSTQAASVSAGPATWTVVAN
jgi:hypothetical protein